MVVTYAFYLQRHDIFKKRIDSHGNVIDVRQEGIGAPQVSGNLRVLKFLQKLSCLYLYELSTYSLGIERRNIQTLAVLWISIN